MALKNKTMKTLGIIKLLIMTLQPTPNRVETYAERIGISETEIVVSQSIAECGWQYESYNARERNNIFGYRGGRVTEDNPKRYSIYNHWTESARAYKEWQDKVPIFGNYYEYLKQRGYSTNPEYCNYVEQVRKIWLRKRQ